MKKILISLSIIGIVAVVAISATLAYFNDTETSASNTFTAGTLDLTIDLQCPGSNCGWEPRDLDGDPFFWNPFDCDIKPGDKGEVTISWHVDNNPAWGRIRLANIRDYEKKCNESEVESGDVTCDTDPTGIYGELSQYLTFTIWMDEGATAGWQCPKDNNKPCAADLFEGDNILNGVETILAVKTARQLIDGVQLPGILNPDFTYYVGLEWNLPFSTPNIVQTDSMVASIIMEVVQSRNNPNPWPTPLVNGGFETGDFTGWNVNYPSLANVVTTYTSQPYPDVTYGPKDGTKFALLRSGAGEGVYTTISQDVTLNAGQKIEGWAAFDTTDYVPFNDNALAQIIVTGVGTTYTPWKKEINDVGSYGQSNWEKWSWTAPNAGTYTIELKVANQGDNAVDSYGLFDAHIIQ